jgi:hypothetical protein
MAGNGTQSDHADQWIKFFAHPDQSVQMRVLQAIIDIDDPRVTSVLLGSFPRFGQYRGVITALTRHREPALVERPTPGLSHAKEAIPRCANSAQSGAGRCTHRALPAPTH